MSVTETLPGASAPVQTRMAYDSNGNVCAVTVGASPSWVASCTNTGSADDPVTAYYQYDDFGNLLTATLPDTGATAKGVTRYVPSDRYLRKLLDQDDD